VSPILTRPVREQFEHDRIIRVLQARYKRKYDVAINPGGEQNQAVTVGELAVYPDLVLFSLNRARKLEGTVEVETGESVNQLEALAEWGVFSKLKVPFHLYVPPTAVDSARRMCDDQKFQVAELWTYHTALDQVRFTLVLRTAVVKPAAPKAAAKPARPSPGTRPAAPKAGKAKGKPAAKEKPRLKARPATVAPRKKPQARAGRLAKSARPTTKAAAKKRR
jgi:hypothetical protein